MLRQVSSCEAAAAWGNLRKWLGAVASGCGFFHVDVGGPLGYAFAVGDDALVGIVVAELVAAGVDGGAGADLFENVDGTPPRRSIGVDAPNL